ncbi:hypothetical protein B0H14DRAFT_2499764 [Mycena olivaceomarginata]|nr:hypothetical protein B0H14DRAFT_2499764 [Mycena olivaceomarginata]
MKTITPANWEDWPTADQVSQLSRAADGLFHYAATALQWITVQIRKDGKSCRSRIWGQFTQKGIGQLEDLYKLILTSFEDIEGPEPPDQQRLSSFRQIIGTILVLQRPLTMQQIIVLLADIWEEEFDVAHFLRQFHSVLIPGTTASFEDATPQMHKSFRDYIMGDHAAVGFRIDVGPAHFVTARSCLEVIVKARGLGDIAWMYAVQHWHRHLRKAIEEGATCDERIWLLFRQMVKEAGANVWAQDPWDQFHDVATAAWGLLKQNDDQGQMDVISSVLVKAKEVGSQTVNVKYADCDQFPWFQAVSASPWSPMHAFFLTHISLASRL